MLALFGVGVGGREVTYGWSHTLAVSWECSPQTKTFPFLLETGF